MSAATESAAREVQSAELPESSTEAQARTPAREATPPTALPLTPVRPAGGDTESLIPPQARAALGQFLGAFVIPRGTNLLAVDHGSLLSAHQRHREAAAQWDYPPVRVFRRTWGFLHLLVKALLDIAEWVTESPARTITAVIATVACLFWL